jgi:ribose transport system ATP-binding protein
MMVGREMTQQFPPRKPCIDTSKVVLELQNVYGNGDEDMSLKIHAGEVLGLGGLVGAGRTELAEVIFGAKAKTAGKIFLNGQEINPKSPREAIDLGIALVPEDRKRHGALLTNSIKNNINMPIYERISKASVIDGKTEMATAEKYREEIQIKCPGVHQLVKNLSGGNQQKVILGKWLAADSQLIIFDEPTRGIDVGAKFEIYKLINDLVESGRSVLMISSEMEELIGMSDRIIVLAEHQMTGELQKEEFNADTIMTLASAIVDQADNSGDKEAS